MFWINLKCFQNSYKVQTTCKIDLRGFLLESNMFKYQNSKKQLYVPIHIYAYRYTCIDTGSSVPIRPLS